MTNYTITAEIEKKFWIPGTPEDEREVAYPKVEITYSYLPGYAGCRYQRNGDPGFPPEAAEVEFVSAKLIDGDGLAPTTEQIKEWAQDWLDDDGYDAACEHAEEMRRPDPDYERERHRDDGQPDEAQEWRDFDPNC